MKTLSMLLISIFAMNAFSEPNFIQISQEKVLHSKDKIQDFKDKKEPDLKFWNLAVFTDAKGRTVILTVYAESYETDEVFDTYGDMKFHKSVNRYKKAAIVGKDNEWTYLEQEALGPQDCFVGSVDKAGQFYLFTYKKPDFFAGYKLEDDLKFSSIPFWEAKVDFEKTRFKNEKTTRYDGIVGVFRPIEQIFVVSKEPFKIYVSGQYQERQKSIISFLGNVISGGHAAYRDRPYVVSIDNNDLKMFPTDNSLKINETGGLDGVMVGNSLCFLKDVAQEYSISYTPQMDYYQYDILQEKWHRETILKPNTPLFDNLVSGRASSLKYKDDKIFFVYSISYEKSVSKSGVYYCEKKVYSSSWEKPEKISETGTSPSIEIDGIGNVYAFWRESGGLFYKYRKDGLWGEKHCLVKNFNKDSLDLNSSYSINLIGDNKIGLTYIKYVDLGKKYPGEDQLVYTEFINEQNK